ncbi:MAG: cupredoxin domain-containing protein [Dehalococcoidaceae bacterium]|nr:cupredoxin domain-containing protein [Dehalococcoidaceae bacterium]
MRQLFFLVVFIFAISVIGPACSPSNGPGNGGTSVDLTASNIAFNLQTITVTAGASVTINFDNRDAGVEHNFALYEDSSAQQSIFIGQIINGPATITYTFDAPTEPGSYFFRCDPHPVQMTGTFIVE